MRPSERRLAFNTEQRDTLRGLGAFEEQIGRLEAVLPRCVMAFRRFARMSDVRAGLRDLEKVLGVAASEVAKAASGSTQNEGDVRAEIRSRLMVAASVLSRESKHPGDSLTMPRVLDTLSEAIRVVRSALDELPQSQRRHTNSSEPIWLIWNALWQGWADLNQQAYDTGSPRPDLPAERPFQFPPSSGEDSKFRQIVEICYAAASGQEGQNPERAIKKFLTELRRPGR